MEKFTDLKRAQVRVTGDFWETWKQNARAHGLMSVYDRFRDTGRFGALDFTWKEGMPNKPHIFWDSDIAKWIEAAAYLLQEKRDPEIEALVDECVDKIEAHQRPDGYFNIWFDTAEPENRFTRYTDHELYDLGHLIEAAVAYRDATGKEKFLNLMLKYASLVDKVFRQEHYAGFDTPGHPELELALFRLYRATDDEKWLNLMRYFVDTRGTSPRDKTYKVFDRPTYSQTHLPVRQQRTAEGHSVRACYLYSGMADLAWQDEDESLKEACRALFHNIAHRRMYVTGGIGSSHVGEAFTFDYDLMNRTAYAETCAALSLALFARRMSRIEPRGEYADIAEKALYNGMLAGVSLDTQSFFYENPLEVHPDVIHFNDYYAQARDHMPITRRVRVFDCSCCPPNVLRLLGSIGDFAFTQSDKALYVHHYMTCQAETAFGPVHMETKYPYDGRILLTLPAGAYDVGLRIPGWCREWKLEKNGEILSSPENRDGYVRLAGSWAEGDQLAADAGNAGAAGAGPSGGARGLRPGGRDPGPAGVLHGGMRQRKIPEGRAYSPERNPLLCGKSPAGRNGQFRLPASRREWPEEDALYAEYSDARRDCTAVFIPYYAWANREEGRNAGLDGYRPLIF